MTRLTPIRPGLPAGACSLTPRADAANCSDDARVFGEFVETNSHTSAIAPEELLARLDREESTDIIDSRTLAKYEMMNMPDGINVRGAERVIRPDQLQEDPEAPIIALSDVPNTRSG